MKETWSAMRKIIAPIMFVALATTGLTVAGTTAAHAVADNEWSVKNTNFGAVQSSPGWIGQYYGANARYIKINALAGGSKTITYKVEHNGVAASAGTTVNFVAGKAWSGSTGVVTVNGQTTSGSDCWCGNDQATTSAVTDSSGNVSFTIDASSAVAATTTQIYAWVANKGNTGGDWSQTADTADVIDINFVASKTAGDYRVRSTNSGTTVTAAPGWANYYSPDMRHLTQTLTSGATSVRTWKVTDNVGNPAAGVTVTMVAGKAYSGSNAVGALDGNATSGVETWSGSNQATSTAVSDANGDVSFTLTNTSGTTSQIAAWVNPNVNEANYISGDSFDIVDLTYSASSGGSSVACSGTEDQACPPNSALSFANGATAVSVTDGAFTSTGSSLSVTVTSPAGAADAGKQGNFQWFDTSGVTLSQGVTNAAGTPWAAGGCYPDGSTSQCQYKLGSDGTATFTIGVSGSGTAKFHSVGTGFASDVLVGTFSGGGSGGGGSTPTPAPAVFLNFASNDDLGKLVGAFEGASGAIVDGHYEFTATGQPWSGMDVFVTTQNKVLTNAANSVSHLITRIQIVQQKQFS